MQTKTWFLALIMVIITIFSAIFSAACTTGGMAALAATPEPTPTATPTITPSPTPEPTPTMDPVPDLTDEEVKAEMELLGITNPDAEIKITNTYLVFYSNINKNGSKEYKIEFATSYLRQSTNTEFMSRFWDEQPMFEFSHDYEYLEGVFEQVYVAPRCESLKNSKVEMITTIVNLEYFSKQFGIPYEIPNTPVGRTITKVQGDYLAYKIEDKCTYSEFADFYIRTFAKANRAVASDYYGPIPYVAPEKTPLPTATVTPS